MYSAQFFVPLPTGYTVLNEASNEATLTVGEHPAPPLIKLLSIATAVRLDILPLKWRPALDSLGEGATGNITQSPLNKEISWAFKRFVHFPDSLSSLSDPNELPLQETAILSEVVTLMHSEIYRHPNVVNLEGLCWEILSDSAKLRPVLIFRKADGGSLEKFLSRHEAKNLSFEDKMDICGEIAKGLRIMHLSGVVHGDLKPENVLVYYSSEPDVFGVKVADLGYSCFGEDDDLVKLPLSPPWQAPEYNPREVTLKAARRMDVYSFGLLVFWLLFREMPLEPDGKDTKIFADAFSDEDATARDLLQIYKQDGSLMSIALELVSRTTTIDDESRCRLISVFQISLEREPERRAPNMLSFLRLLCKDDVLEPLDFADSVDPVRLPEWHGNLEIANFFFEMDACDFRVQSCVAESLMTMAKSLDCQKCSQNAALQLALCYSFGFGVRSSREETLTWLKFSGKTEDDLVVLFDRVKDMDPPVVVMRQISDLGFQSNLGHDYYHDGVLEEAIQEHRRMAKDRELAFGRSHFAARRMYAVLSDLLAYDHQLEEAAATLVQELDVTARLDGARSNSLPLIQSKLARIRIREGKLDEAEAIANSVLEWCMKETKGVVHLRLPTLCDLSSIISKKGDQKEAVKLALAAVEESREHLGPFHETTWRIKGVLVDAYIKNGELEQSIRTIKEVVDEKGRSFGEDDPDTIMWMSKLGPLYVRLNQWENARHCFQAVFEALQQSDPKDPLQELLAHSNYMGAVARTGEAAHAARVLEEILSKLSITLPSDNLHVLGTKNNLSIAYQYQGLYEAAEPLQREVVDCFQRALPDGDSRTLLMLANLTDTLFYLGKWQDVVRFSLEEINARESRLEGLNKELVHAIRKAARSSVHLEKWDDAAQQLERELTWRNDLRMSDNIDSLEATALLATAYVHLGRRGDASTRIGYFFELFLKIQKGHNSLLNIVYELMELCESHKMLPDTAELSKLAVILWEKLPRDSSGGQQGGLDEAKILKLRGKLGDTEEIIFDPTAFIGRSRQVRS